MKILSFLFLPLVVCFSCGSGEAQTEPNAIAPPAVNTPTETEAGPITSPCESISQTDIVAAFGWASSNEGRLTAMRDGRLQSCLFMSKDGSGQASVTISLSDERTIERKYLEKSFVSTLAKEDDRLSFEEVNAGLGDQAIYTTGKRGPHHLYKLRWRKGNEVDYDVTLRATKKQNKTAMLATLKGLAERL